MNALAVAPDRARAAAVTSAALFAGYEQRRPSLRSWLARHYVEAFDLLPGRLLDAGCGNGFWASLFAERGFAVSGFDANAEFIADGRAQFPELDLQVGDVLTPPVYPEPFDLVFCRTIPHFYAERIEDAVTVIASLLTYGAPLLLSAYSDGSGEARPGLFTNASLVMHPHRVLIEAFERAGGAIGKTASVGNYLQIMGRPA